MILGDGLRGRPNDERAFIHKKILGGVALVSGIAAKFGVPGARAVSTVTSTLAGTRSVEKNLGATLKFAEPRVLPEVFTTRQITSRAPLQAPRAFGGHGTAVATCPPGMRPDFQSGQCEAAAGQAVGEAIMGRYGAGLLPGEMIIERAVCLKGMQLGDDGVCYNKSQISNKQRMWPAGRKPLLSGGDMRAITIAARAGRRLEGATKRLQRLGMMKKPASGRRIPARHQHALPAPAVSVQ